ncbi:methyltransferase domain-containing protein [Vibrio sp. V27_P1S3P104]|uniref:class I SAM-dependent methyltransferase n=1 Tax=Vibrio TaxID=662 RepID=UPI000C16D3E7|nr:MULTISPECIES: class I SAM-dependent methyltransferase [Vibrio]NAW68541.1 methyltransferase domain-containing protein [Vibrio sp. V28_P6S34P95]NAX06566.1 methyltransferase domain-containing protein [Vibrio sp. V30_P3S12P165]NAX34839.1 methyltransferase domain-containing protein [Vibrio sp. V29_P1S30P107]NAX37256.1 methyltransferase domain-containing protein [Vibrio sp. V27_P1S3P104]NAX41219.1 methyltransferase domain-containing protein [Vibrio sp. V26_P1S5P106]
MKPARSQKKIKSPHSWSQLKNGQWVCESIQTRIDEWCPKLFGYHMLKLGGLSCELSSCNCNIQHQVNLDIQNPLHSVIADAYDLPFLEKSIDVAILAHQLDYCGDPHRILREVDRVLIDDGYLIITGFNPISLIGLASLMPWRKHNLPWSGRMFTPSRIRDWLSVLNYQVIECDQYALFPMQKYRAGWTWLENASGRWARPLGSLYFIVARKRTYPLKPIKPHWHLKRRFSPLGLNYRIKSSE